MKKILLLAIDFIKATPFIVVEKRKSVRSFFFHFSCVVFNVIINIGRRSNKPPYNSTTAIIIRSIKRTFKKI